jgi:hypothetical protein
LAGQSSQADLTLSSCVVAANSAEGGAGAPGGDGGNGEGGGLFNDTGATTTVRTSAIVANQAEGGDAGAGGSDGKGIGGGVYNLGVFKLDAVSVINNNHASNSHDDVFGPITPL